MPALNLWRAARRLWADYRRLAAPESFSIDTDLAQYEVEIKALLYAVWSGEIEQAEFERRMIDLLAVFALALLIAGLLHGGVKIVDLDQAVAEMQDTLREWVAGQVEHVGSFARDVAAAREDRNMRLGILNRVNLWSRSLRGLANVAAALRRPDEFLTFVGGDGAESCAECQSMKGRRQPAQWWIVNNLIPGIPGTPAYSCGGWQCHHILVNDAGEPRLP